MKQLTAAKNAIERMGGRLIERPPMWFRRLVPGGLFRLPPCGSGSRRRVCLTFDDGPIPEVTPWVLDMLDRYGVKATFFMVGENVERHPELLEEVQRRGHSVGNHTHRHVQGVRMSTRSYLRDVSRCDALTGRSLFRPPHGWLRPRQARALRSSHRIVMYDLVTRDYSRRVDAARVVENVRRLARDGSIIVFHDSVKSWPRLKEALEPCLRWLKDEGYEFTRL